MGNEQAAVPRQKIERKGCRDKTENKSRPWIQYPNEIRHTDRKDENPICRHYVNLVNAKPQDDMEGEIDSKPRCTHL